MRIKVKRWTALLLVLALLLSGSVLTSADGNVVMKLPNEPQEVDEVTRLFNQLAENGDKVAMEPPEASQDDGKSSVQRAAEQFLEYEVTDGDSALRGDIRDLAKNEFIDIFKEKSEEIFGDKKGLGGEILDGFLDAANDISSAVQYVSPQEHATFRVANTAIGYYVAITNGFIHVVDAAGFSVCTVPLKLLVKVLQYGRDFIDQPEVVNTLNSMNPWFMKILDWFFAVIEEGFTHGSRDGWGMPRNSGIDETTWRIRMSQQENCYKPNIYLYGEPGTQLTVSFDEPELLTKVLPDYDDAWDVTLEADGSLTVDGAGGYGYLFYESLTLSALMQQEEGFCIQADRRAEQFEAILQAYGFNETEIRDFIEFWVQKLEPGVDYVMYPQLTDTVDGAMPITVTGAAVDSYYRIWFYFEKADGADAAEPDIVPVQHKGLTLIEWGGIVE